MLAMQPSMLIHAVPGSKGCYCWRRAPAVAPPQGRPCLTIARAAGKKNKQKREQVQQLTASRAPDVGIAPAQLNGQTAAPPTGAPQPQQPQQQAPPPIAAQPPPAAAAAAVAAAPKQSNWPNIIWKRVIRELSSLPRAIGIMAVITTLSALGTVIPQNKEFDYYVSNYPIDGSKVLGVLDYRLLLGLQLDHIYTAWYFYGSIALLGASLMACTYSTQWPTAKVAQRWRFAASPTALQKHGTPQVLPNARLQDLGRALVTKSYQVFLQDGQLYAFKGLAGRLGPIGVHIALLMCLFGTGYSGFGGWKGTALIPEGGEFLVASALYPASQISTLPSGAKAVMQVNKFNIDTRPDGSVAQFYSDLSLRDLEGRELQRKTISVNDPFRYGGVTMYQTDWGLAAVTVRLVEPPAGTEAGSTGAGAGATEAAETGQLLQQLQQQAEQQQAEAAGLPAPSSSSSSSRLPQRAFSLPFASLEGRPGVPKGSKLYATFLPLELPKEDGRPPRGISLLAHDLDTITFYDSKGEFVGVRRAGSGKPIKVEGLDIVVEDIVGSTGLELKSDPGVPLVYAGFGALMITTLISYISHSQVWALQQGGSVYLVGRSNRSKVLFEQELDAVMDAVPELPAGQLQAAANGAQGASARATAAGSTTTDAAAAAGVEAEPVAASSAKQQ